MFQNFSQNLLKSVASAQESARLLGFTEVTPELLFLALTQLDDDPATIILRKHGAENTIVSPEIEKLKAKASKNDSIPLSESAKELLGHAFSKSQSMQSSECTTEHLLVSLLQDPQIIRLLDNLNISVPEIQSELCQANCSESVIPTNSTDSENLKRQIATWHNRAQMARKQGNEDLVQQALEQKQKYEKLLAESQ